MSVLTISSDGARECMGGRDDGKEWAVRGGLWRNNSRLLWRMADEECEPGALMPESDKQAGQLHLGAIFVVAACSES